MEIPNRLLCGSFANEYGEEFVVFEKDRSLVITGDEFGWIDYKMIGLLKTTSIMTPYVLLLEDFDDGDGRFVLQQEEYVELEKIMEWFMEQQKKLHKLHIRHNKNGNTSNT